MLPHLCVIYLFPRVRDGRELYTNKFICVNDGGTSGSP